MTKIKLLSGAALAAAALLPVAAPAEPASVPGPGGVIHAVRAFLTAIDQGDAAGLGAGLTASELWAEKGGMVELTRVVDRTAAGGPFAATDLTTLPAAILADLHRDGMTTTVRSIAATCASEHCSYAYVEFDRAYPAGDESVVQPMCATAILRYAGQGKPDFRIYHWHASPRGDAAK